ncbi:MAG: RAD55 family ATPase [Halobacteriota archaeon]
MYDLSPTLDVQADPGTNLILSGPPLTGKRSLGLEVLADGLRNGEGAIVVTTKDGADRILSEVSEHVDYGGKPFAVIDCVTRQQGVGEVTDTEYVKYASSPVDMTGIGIKLSEVLQSFYQDREVRENRIMLHSLSTLLMYSDLQTVFRFLHVFTGRIQSVNGLGLFAIDADAHDDRTMNTLKQLFDGIIQTSETNDPQARLAGE